ncbi:MAG: hypothetical protein HOA78_02725 [Cryomorphaceae bacterium]|jgi:hypothetical protein|nr:hypothetical protein [Cryomorphaceae bacterium]MBT3684107.1 hypothetical protein [Cryomorphaceae bacterium]MBT4813338.1 hypothetical protein [Cryomorphaceae bacterium]MBT5416996.1 hypothetical protein [Cryomorphaceae bacterium]MBT6729668.1 hypothetical protein [Cryomorphaceae bacterium]
MDLDKLIKGIELLNKDTLPNWGKMNSSMMLKHCSAFIDVYLNKTKLNPLIFVVGFIFGVFHRLYLKYIVGYNVKKYIKNLPTLKVFNTYRCENLNFEFEKNKLINDLKEVESINKKYLVNNFHGIVPNKAFKKVVYFHTSYHLYQFGVYN